VSPVLHWFLAVVLVAGSVLNGVAFAGTAEVPCPMTASDNAGHPPCGDCGDPAASCAQLCAALGTVMLSAIDPISALSDLPAGRVAACARDVFSSHAGPPGLQPPR
jgi:hypothetical protein